MLRDSEGQKATPGHGECPSHHLIGRYSRHGLKCGPASPRYVPPLPAGRTKTPANSLYHLYLPP